MPLQALKDYNEPGSRRFLIGLVGQGPSLGALVRILERDDFVRAFPRIKVAGWVPTPGSMPESGSLIVPGILRNQRLYPDVRSLFAARPGILLALDLSGKAEYTPEIRTFAPQAATVASGEAILRFCMAAEDGKLAIGGGESLRKAHSLFSLIVDQMDDDIIILDANGVILDLNRYCAESRGLVRGKMIGRPCTELDRSIPCCEDEVNCPFEEAKETGRKAEYIYTQVMPSGRVRYLQTICFPLSDPYGVPSQILFMRRDVTEKQHMEQRIQQTEKMAAIGELSTYMAHEIRNPIFAIGGFANALLRNPTLDDSARQKAKVIYDESRRLDTILTSILNFARPTEQTLGIFDAEAVARQTLELMTLGAQERGITASVVVGPNLPKVSGNAENLKQCLINLVKNAIEAMPGGGKLTLDLERNDGHVQLDVIDTGRGIAAELHDQVFSPFFTTKQSGAGLGLAMTRKVIEEMGGKVILTSQLGKGTRISLLLPAALEVVDEDDAEGDIDDGP